MENIENINSLLYGDGIQYLVLSGGGIKGFAHIGAIAKLEHLNIIQNIHTFAGSSIGAIVSFLYIIGYTPSELLTIDFKSKELTNGNMKNIPSKFGFTYKNTLLTFIGDLCERKGFSRNITFFELFFRTKKTIYVTVACLTDNCPCYLSYFSEPNMSVVKAVSMSANIPLLFPPISFKEKLYIDGGFMDNYPIHLFPKDKTIGVYLLEDTVESKLDDFEAYIFRIFQSILTGYAMKLIKEYKKNTIILKTTYTNLFSFDITPIFKQQLFEIGYRTVDEYYTKYFSC